MKRTETFSFESPHIDVENSSGNVELVTHDEATVVVTVEAIRPQADELVEATKIVARGDGVKVSVPGASGFRKREVLVRIAMPATSTVNVSTVSADVASHGCIAEAVIKTVSGDIRLDEVLKSVELKTISGDIEIGHSPVELFATSTSGDIRLNKISGNCSVKSVSGDCSVHASGIGKIDVKTVSGDVSVLVNPDIEIDVSAQTVSGQLSSEIDLETTGSGTPGSALTIHSRTVSGDVRIRRASLVG
jgi:hypothetical protein